MISLDQWILNHCSPKDSFYSHFILLDFNSPLACIKNPGISLLLNVKICIKIYFVHRRCISNLLRINFNKNILYGHPRITWITKDYMELQGSRGPPRSHGPERITRPPYHMDLLGSNGTSSITWTPRITENLKDHIDIQRSQ